MKKDHRLSIRVRKELYDKLHQRATKNKTDSAALEARLILEKALTAK